MLQKLCDDLRECSSLVDEKRFGLAEAVEVVIFHTAHLNAMYPIIATIVFAGMRLFSQVSAYS